MIITYHGHECFRVQFGELVIALNPPSKSSSLKTVSFGADIALLSLNHEDTNGVSSVSRGEKDPFVISSPGEYEISGVSIAGFGSRSKYASLERVNTMYRIVLEDITLLFLGALSTTDMSPEAKEALDEIDILFLPIGGGDVLDPKNAHALSVHLEPKIVIPMHYDEKALRQFLKEEGADAKPQDKLTVKRKDLSGKEGEVVVLKAG